jgi:hypothetical protein
MHTQFSHLKLWFDVFMIDIDPLENVMMEDSEMYEDQPPFEHVENVNDLNLEITQHVPMSLRFD